MSLQFSDFNFHYFVFSITFHRAPTEINKSRVWIGLNNETVECINKLIVRNGEKMKTRVSNAVEYVVHMFQLSNSNTFIEFTLKL